MSVPWGQGALSSIYECYDEDRQRLDLAKFYRYRRAQREELENDDWIKIIAVCGAIASEEKDASESLPSERISGAKRKYTPPQRRIYRDPADDLIRAFGPLDTEWYRNYVDCLHTENTKFRSKFRRHFRCSYNSFHKHLSEVKQSNIFKAWADGNIPNRVTLAWCIAAP
ncbi:hypothetical protein ACHAWF_008136 [Thalassiosira exigua]